MFCFRLRSLAPSVGRPLVRRFASSSSALSAPPIHRRTAAVLGAGISVAAVAFFSGNVVIYCDTGGRKRTDILRDAISALIDVDGDGNLTQQEVFDFFDRMDVNKDGTITFEELYSFLVRQGMQARDRLAIKELFDILDVDGSGDISKEEFFDIFRLKRRPCDIVKQKIGQLIDVDGDGNLSASELGAFFDRLDVNKDGSLSEDEWYRGLIREGFRGKDEKAIKQLFAEMDEDDSGDISKREFVRLFKDEVKKPSEKLKAKLVAMIDSDGDGDLSPKEFEAFFKKIDVNRDGSLSFEELYKFLLSNGFTSRDREAIKEVFSEVDKDGSGDITLSELISVFKTEVRKPEAVLKEKICRLIDSDGDGDVSVAELTAFFRKVDVNGDGSITFEEFYNYLVSKSGGMSAKDRSTIQAVFKELDVDGSGDITCEEFMGMFRRE